MSVLLWLAFRRTALLISDPPLLRLHRILAIMTAIFLTCYMAWMYADSRHRVNGKKNRKLFALNKLRLYQMQLAIGEKSAGHRKKLLTGFLVLFILWLPPALMYGGPYSSLGEGRK